MSSEGSTSGSKSPETAIKSTTSMMDAMALDNAGLQKTALGFLDLPIEIRLDIYEHLLLARVGMLPLNAEAAYSVQSPVELGMVWASERGIVWWPENRGQDANFPGLGIPKHCETLRTIYPAIISTCRTVHEEARTVLYGKNAFRIIDCPVSPYEYNRALAQERVFRYQCDNVFKHESSKNDWRRSGAFLLSDAPIAHFLNKIGPRNAASVKVLELTVKCKFSGNNPLTADLLMPHFPALKVLRVFVPHACEECVIRGRKKAKIQDFCLILGDSVRGRCLFEVYDYQPYLVGDAPDLEARPEYLMSVVPVLDERDDLMASGTDSEMRGKT
ncbi:hypothetical protein BDR22DRAFT_892979 [Usnea florida]